MSEIVLCFDRDFCHYFLFILKGVLDFLLTTSAGNREVWKTSQRQIRPLIGSIGEYRARFPGGVILMSRQISRSQPKNAESSSVLVLAVDAGFF
mgnify:CR=1 FL=1